MARFTLIAMSNAVEDRDDEFSQWYDQHLKDVAAIEGITGARRLKLAAGDNRWRYLAIYDAVIDKPEIILQEIRRRSGTTLMPVSDALDKKTVYFSLFAEGGA
jgi:hypothetical protein